MELLTTLIFDMWGVLAQSLIFGIGLTLGVRLVLGMVAPANASTRFAVWFVTLLGIAALPPVLLIRTVAPTLVARQKAPAVRESAQAMPSPATPVALKTPVFATPVSAHVAPAAPAPLPTPRVSDTRAAFQTQLFMPVDAAATLLMFYAIGVVCMLFGRLGYSYLRLRRLKVATSPTPPEVQERFEQWLAQCNVRRPVQLLLSSSARSPMAAGFIRPAVIIPDSLLLRLTGEELDHLGLHELAHIRRYDDWTNLTQRVIQAVFFFNPAVHWICRKLEFEREVACDDRVLTLTGSAKRYCQSLTKILEHASWQRGLALASGAVFRKRQIFRRIEMLLDATRDSKPGISGVTFVLILMCVFGALSEIVRIPALVAFGNDHGGPMSRSIWSMDGRRIETETRGEVQFAADDTSVQSISPGGYLRIRETGWTSRELQIRSGDSAKPEIRYRVDGRERPFDDKGREWANGILLLVIREQGIDAEERALRILAKRGAAGLFDEIDRISSDHSRQRYLTSAMRSGKLNTDDMRRAMSRAGRIGSDHDKANLLLDVAGIYATDVLRGSYFDAVNTINSDHDRARVLNQLVAEAETDSAVLANVGRSVEQMSSDHEKAQLLQKPALRMSTSDPAVRRSILRATESIQSDHDKASVLSVMLREEKLSPEVLQAILEVAAKIQSDHDKAGVLELAARQGTGEGFPQAAFVAAAGTIQSDNERSRALSSIVDRDLTAAPVADDLARTIGQISSDHEKANVLIKLASRPSTPAFLSAVRSIQSDSDKRRVIEAMLERGNSAEAAKDAVTLGATINSDHDKAQVLSVVAQKYSGEPAVREALIRAAEKISSDSEYRRIVSALYAKSAPGEPKARD